MFVRLTCVSPESAAAVVDEAMIPGDAVHTARADGCDVVLEFADPRFPMDVAEWAFTNGHAHDADAAHVIGLL